MPERNAQLMIEREVGATREDFLRGLRLAFPDGVREEAGVIRVDCGAAAMEITLTPLPPIAIALLRMPLLKVSLRGTAGSAADQTAMLARMDLAMQRGGG